MYNNFVKFTTIKISDFKVKNMTYNYDNNINGISDTYNSYKKYYKYIVKNHLKLINKNKNKDIKVKIEYPILHDIEIQFFINYDNDYNTLKEKVKILRDNIINKIKEDKEEKEINYLYMDYTLN